MEAVAKYTNCLSNWQLNLAPGLQTVGALILLGTGGLYIVSRALTFIRVILSLFVLPGQPVCLEFVFQWLVPRN